MVCQHARMTLRRATRFGAHRRQRLLHHRPLQSALSLRRMMTGSWLSECQASGCWLWMLVRVLRKFGVLLSVSSVSGVQSVFSVYGQITEANANDIFTGKATTVAEQQQLSRWRDRRFKDSCCK